jgi:enoyl-CoA hydratase/carnithine racemase
MLTSTETLRLEFLDQNAIAVITLQDPEHANAMTPEMGDAFSEAIHRIQSDPAVRAVIIRGAGEHFSIGGHRDMLVKLGNTKMSEAELREFMLDFYSRWLAMIDLEIPVIPPCRATVSALRPFSRLSPISRWLKRP